MKIGIFYIATSSYKMLWQAFYDSAMQNFMPGVEKTFIVITDEPGFFSGFDHVKTHKIEHRPWPYPTLMRFHYFLECKPLTERLDFLFFCNADLKITGTVSPEILPAGDQLLATIHPGYANRPKHKWPFEPRRASRAYVPFWKAQHYVAGGFYGARCDSFLSLSHTVSDWTDQDLAKGLMPLWHDESLLNRYVYEQGAIYLPPSYLYQEGKRLPFEQTIVVRNKQHILPQSALGKYRLEAKPLHIQIRKYADWIGSRFFPDKQDENRGSK